MTARPAAAAEQDTAAIYDTPAETAQPLDALIAAPLAPVADLEAPSARHAEPAAPVAEFSDALVEEEEDLDAELSALSTWNRHRRQQAAPSALTDTELRSARIDAHRPAAAERHAWLPPTVDALLAELWGRTLAELGDDEAARSAFERAVGLERETLAAWHGLGRARLRCGDLAGGEAALLAALELAGGDAASNVRIHRELGEVALLERRSGHALVALERAHELAPRDPDVDALLERARTAHEARARSDMARPGAPTELSAETRLHARAAVALALAKPLIPPVLLRDGERIVGRLARPRVQKLGWTLAGVLALLLPLGRLLRGRGDLTVALEYPMELRGTFTVRLETRPPPRRKRSRRSPAADVLKGGASSRLCRYLVSRETQFRGLRPGRYWLRVEGLMQSCESEEILADLVEDKQVVVARSRTSRIECNFQPNECAVDINVLWDKRPAKEAGVVAMGMPGSLRYARGGAVRMQLAPGRHEISIGSGDRVVVCQVDVDSYQPKSVTVDLAGTEKVVFKGCPPAVDLYLHGDIAAAARALEREGQADQGRLLLARLYRDAGRLGEAAAHYEAAGALLEAAEIHVELDQPTKAAPLFDRAGEPRRAAEMHRRAGATLEAGAAFERARDFEAAIECYREAGAVTQWIDALERCGSVFEASQVALERKERRRAIRLLQQVLPEDPRHLDACRQLAAVLEEEGHSDLAAQKLEEYLRAAGPEGGDPDLQFHLAELLANSDHIERSLQVLEELRRSDPTYPNLATRIETLRKRRSAEHSAGLRASASNASSGRMRETAPLLSESRYDIIEEIGRGGMGVVFRAHDKRLNREVALKRMPPNLREHPKAVQYFLREAQAAARLNHRNIVTVYDVDQEDGIFFITMELLKGHPLNAVLRKKQRISARDVAKLGIQVAAGLEYAHEQGVVHRDIKTANLFLTTARTVTIMDFGLAKMVEEVRRGSTIIGGTPYYMAPEQAAGEQTDRGADLYALGVTLFELLTGRVPFDDGDVTYQHRHTPPPDPRTLATGVPDALAELILQLMEKDRAARPATADEVRLRLDQMLRATG